MIEEIFAFWQLCAKHPRSRLDDKRVRAIRAALRWGYTIDDLKLAVYGCCSNPWYSEGRNERGGIYTHIGLILRDADHVDRFIQEGAAAVEKCRQLAIAEDERRTTERDRVREIPAGARSKIERLFPRRRG